MAEKIELSREKDRVLKLQDRIIKLNAQLEDSKKLIKSQELLLEN